MLCDVIYCYLIFNTYSCCLLCGTKEHSQPENPRFPPGAAAQTSVLVLAGRLGTANGRMDMGASINGGIPKMMVYSGKSYFDG